MRTDLARFFSPRSIAIIGASQDLISISGQPLKHLVTHKYAGKLYPVNPKYQEILGVKCYPSLAALPEAPELALVLINAARVADTLRECGKLGVPYAIVFSSGFSETGGKGVTMQRELAAIAAEYEIGIIGPNCQGMINPATNVYAGFGSIFNADYTAGRVSMVSQSGGFGFSVMNLAAMDGGVHFRQMVTTGNETGISTLDFLNYFVDDPDTDIIACYIEGLKDAHRLIGIGGRALTRKKPIFAWKVGNTDEGRKAAASHTANLGGEMALYKAAFRQCGIIQVDDIQDVVDYSRAFQCGKLPAGNRVAIITISGGAGILITDECVGRGMQVPQLSAATTEKLRGIVPSFGSVLNPIDVTAAIFSDLTMISRTLNAVLDDPNIDAVAMLNASLQGDLAASVAREIVAVAKHSVKPIFLSWSARDSVAVEAYAMLDAAKIPHYKSPVRCGRALSALSWYAGALRNADAVRAEEAPVITSVDARRMLAGKADDVTEYAAKQVLAHYGIGITTEELATSREQAVTLARRIGYPVVLKVQSPDISHKTEAQAVRLGLTTDAAVAAAYDEILRNAQAYTAGARIEGVLVQEMVSGGIEAILGVTNDKLFGPAVMFGLGGIFAEVLKDVTYRVAPFGRRAGREMLSELRGSGVFAGVRGGPALDADAVVEALVALSHFAWQFRDRIAEIDINPVMVRPRGKGAIAVDALVVLCQDSARA